MVCVFKNVGKRSTKNCCHVSYVVITVFEKLVNNRIVDHLWPFF